MTAQATEVRAEGLRVARAVQKCMYLLPTQSQRVLKRTAAECAGMTLVTLAVVESVDFGAAVDSSSYKSAHGGGMDGASCFKVSTPIAVV